MQKYIKLYIDSQVCDLPAEDFGIELSYRASNGFTPAGASSERSISLPASKTNDTIFSQWWDALQDIKAGTEYKRMYLEAEGLPVIEGQAQLKEAILTPSHYGANGIGYKVALYGGNSDWIVQLGALPLSDLDWSAERHDYTQANILPFLGSLPPVRNYNYNVWKLMDWKYQQAIGEYCVQVDEFQPFLFIQPLIEKIFNYLGYTINSNFIYSDYVLGLVLPTILPSKYPKEFNAAYLDGSWERNVPITYTGAVGVTGAGLDFNSHIAPPVAPDPFQDSVVFGASFAGAYTARARGYYKIFYALTIDNILTGSGNVDIALLVTGAGAISGNASHQDVVNGQTITGSFIVFIDLNSVLNTYIVWGPDPAVGESFDVTYAKVEVFGEAAEITLGAPIDFAYLLQDWTCADFLRGFGELFNLQYETDVARQIVTIEPKDPYLYQLQPATSQVEQGFLRNVTTDSNNKWVVSDSTSDEFNPDNVPNITVFKYQADDNDPTVKSSEVNGIFTLYESRCTRNTNRFEEGDQVLENSFFAPTMHLIDPTITWPTSTKTVLVPMLMAADYNEDPTQTDKVQSYKPRILYYDGLRSDVTLRIIDTVGNIQSAQMPQTWAVNYNDLTGLDPCLSYSDQTLNGITVQGLAKRFYLRDMARIRSGRTRSTNLYLNAVDILNLTFRDKILLGGTGWILQEVNGYKPMSVEPTKVVLQLDQPDETEDINSFSNSPVQGFVSNILYL